MCKGFKRMEVSKISFYHILNRTELPRHDSVVAPHIKFGENTGRCFMQLQGQTDGHDQDDSRFSQLLKRAYKNIFLSEITGEL